MSSDAADHTTGDLVPTKDKVLETAAGLVQNLAPVKQICAHLNAFHAYADDPNRFVEANHYCSHVTPEFRQCILYDGPGPNARLIGIEYMITPRLYNTLPQDERHLWHSHVFEVKSGMLIMPCQMAAHSQVTKAAWEKAETAEMREVITLYGKVYHLWQTDRGDELPLGEPKLMTSFTAEGQMKDFDSVVGERDRKFAGVDWREKKEARREIEEPEIQEDADWTWHDKKGKGPN